MSDEKKKVKLSEATKAKIDEFTEADAKFKREWAKFEEEHKEIIEELELLRDKRNQLLDEAQRAIRTEAEESSYLDVRSLAHGPFTAMKRWQSFYDPAIFIALAMKHDLFEDMVAEGVITHTTVVDDKLASVWLNTKKVTIEEDGKTKEVFASRLFEASEDGRELSVSVSRPGVIPSFGTEVKDKKPT